MRIDDDKTYLVLAGSRSMFQIWAKERGVSDRAERPRGNVKFVVGVHDFMGHDGSSLVIVLLEDWWAKFASGPQLSTMRELIQSYRGMGAQLYYERVFIEGMKMNYPPKPKEAEE